MVSYLNTTNLLKKKKGGGEIVLKAWEFKMCC